MNGKPWTARDLLSLVDFKEVQHHSWQQIGEALSRTAQACQVRYSGVLLARQKASGLAPVVKQRRPMVDYPCKVAKAPAAPATNALPVRDASGRTVSTARLLIDAELRSRIAELGITAGLFGDPLPGRSALDRKRAGEIA